MAAFPFYYYDYRITGWNISCIIFIRSATSESAERVSPKVTEKSDSRWVGGLSIFNLYRVGDRIHHDLSAVKVYAKQKTWI